MFGAYLISSKRRHTDTCLHMHRGQTLFRLTDIQLIFTNNTFISKNKNKKREKKIVGTRSLLVILCSPLNSMEILITTQNVKRVCVCLRMGAHI